MSSRNTFITNYLYSPEAAKAIVEALEGRAALIHNHGQFVSGYMKNAFHDYYAMFDDCKAALRTIDYSPEMVEYFDLVLMGDDESAVAHSGDYCFQRERR